MCDLNPLVCVVYLTRSIICCFASRSETAGTDNHENHLPSFSCTRKVGVKEVLWWKNSQNSNFCPQLQQQHQVACAFTCFFYCLCLCVSSWILKRLCYCPPAHQSPHHPTQRSGIEAKRLIALVTSIRIHLKTGLETKWWFLNFETDLDIWVSKLSYLLGYVCVCFAVY